MIQEMVPTREIQLNAGCPTVSLRVANTSDRPIQVGSLSLLRGNEALDFERAITEMHLDIPAGTAVRFEPGDEQVTLVPLAGSRQVYGFNGRINGQL